MDNQGQYMLMKKILRTGNDRVSRGKRRLPPKKERKNLGKNGVMIKTKCLNHISPFFKGETNSSISPFNKGGLRGLNEKGNIMVVSFIIVMTLLLSGVTLNFVLRGQVGAESGLSKRTSGYIYNIDEAYIQARILAEWAVNKAIYEANIDSSAAFFNCPAGGVSGCDPINGFNSGWRNTSDNSEGLTDYKVYKFSTTDTGTSGVITGTGRVYLTTDKIISPKFVEKIVYANWDQSVLGNGPWRIIPGTWREDQ